MSDSKRGPERRQAHDVPATDGRNTPEERRAGAERRRNGWVSSLDLCRGLPYNDVEAILEICPLRHLEPGEILLEPGQANHYLFFLVEGQLDVRLKSTDSPVTDTIEHGECIGEMSIIDGQPTSACVIATTASTLIAVHENIFWSKLATNQRMVRNLSRVLAERMRKRNAATLRAVEQEMRLEQLQKELLAAYEIQTGMLPHGPTLVPELPQIDVYARMDVVKSVGGDFFDAFALDERRACIAVGDVSGKGMPAALFMVRALTLLRAELIKPGDLGASLCRFNRALCETNISHMFVSLVVMTFDTLDGTVTYVNAGHMPILLSRAGGPFVDVDDSRGLIAGVLGDTVYEPGTITLDDGDRLVLYTDGVTEARDRERLFYRAAGLTAFVNHAEPGDSQGLVDGIFDDVRRFVGTAPPSDDVTVLGVTFNRTAA
jgi:sigma-B regulation protein RsbU (phosphoserine phosphatase)